MSIFYEPRPALQFEAIKQWAKKKGYYQKYKEEEDSFILLDTTTNKWFWCGKNSFDDNCGLSAHGGGFSPEIMSAIETDFKVGFVDEWQLTDEAYEQEGGEPEQPK